MAMAYHNFKVHRIVWNIKIIGIQNIIVFDLMLFYPKELTAAVLLDLNTVVYYTVLLLKGIGLKERNLDSTILLDLQQQLAEIHAEKAFLQDGCKKTKETYETKRKQHHVGEQSLFALAWEVETVIAMIHSIQEMLQLASPTQCRRVNTP